MGSEEEEYDWGAYDFNWSISGDAEAYVLQLIDDFMMENNRAGELAGSIEWGTSARFLDWIDHMVVPEDAVDEYDLAIKGFVEDTDAETMYGARCFRHRGSVLPPLLLRQGNLWELAIGVQELNDFSHRHVRTVEIIGDPFDRYRWLGVNRERNHLLTAVNRRGYDGFTLEDAYDIEAYKDTIEAFRTRQRVFPNDGEGVQATRELVEAQLDDLEVNRVADAWFRTEWEYWESHNRAARVQKERQDYLGLGWSNHDHQAYRCSREHYTEQVRILELLGLRRREAFHAGDRAGWGALVMENPVGPFVVFCDVDMATDEKDLDFATEGFEPRDELGTIGLWVGLHGESMLQAGLHHMAIRVDMKRAIQDLDTRDVDCMPLFSTFDFLRQCFTVAEPWAVDETRATRLLEAKAISQESFDIFGEVGAVGSHLELIERNEGFKGFSKDSVSTIITHTDPRIGH